MTLRRLYLLLLLSCLLPFSPSAIAKSSRLPAAPAAAAAAPRPEVMLIELHDTMQPERADLLVDSLSRANRDHVAAVIINLSSPGGLVDSTDRMVTAIRQSNVPVIVWGGSGNSRISGQALRLLASADVALMTPMAYASPLWTEVPRGLKAAVRSAGSAEFTTALARSITEHGRNASAVDELSSGIHWFTAREALQAGFIDGIADKEADVLRYVTANGYRRYGVHHSLNLANANVVADWPAPQSDLQLALMNPNLCVLLGTLGLLLIYLEVNTPGVVIPGACGLLLVLLAGYSLSRLPLSKAGIGLCFLAIALLLLESQFHQRGVLAIAGIVVLVSGLGLLVPGPLPQLQVNWGTAVGAGVGFGGITASLMLLGIEARRAKIRTGSDAMLGWLAVAHTALAPEGQVLVRGELWRARLTTNDSTVAAGDHVKVLRADGLVLEVTAVPMATSA